MSLRPSASQSQPSETASQFLGGFGDPETGNVWVRRTYEKYQPNTFVERQILVPFDESEPVLEIELPRNFSFTSAVDDLIAGVYVEPETEVESVRVYRWHVRCTRSPAQARCLWFVHGGPGFTWLSIDGM